MNIAEQFHRGGIETGIVRELNGIVMLSKEDGTVGLLKPGMLISQNDVLFSKSGGNVVLQFSSGWVAKLLHIDQPVEV